MNIESIVYGVYVQVGVAYTKSTKGNLCSGLTSGRLGRENAG